MSLCTLFELYCDGELSAEDRSRFETHLKTCSNCAQMVALWRDCHSEYVTIKDDETKYIQASVPKKTSLTRQELLDAAQQGSPKSGMRIWVFGFATTALLLVALWFTLGNNEQHDLIHDEPKMVEQTPVSKPPVAIAQTQTPGQQPKQWNVTTGSIESTKDGSGQISIGDSQVTLAASTRVSLTENEETRTGLTLDRGSIVCKVAKLDEGSKFEVTAGKYTVSVVGTVFTVNYSQAEEFSVAVTEGIVEVKTPEGNVHRLLQGEYYPPADDTKPKDNESATSTKSKPNDTDPTAQKPHLKWRQWIIAGKVDDAIKEIAVYVERFPADGEAWSLLATCHRKQGNFPGAAKSYGKAIDTSDSRGANQARFKAGILMQEKLADHKSAADLFGDYLDSGAHSKLLEAEAMERQARSLLVLGKRAKAKELLEQILQKHANTTIAAKARKLLKEMSPDE